MSASLDRLYQLLPAVHRIRDHDRGEPLRALLQVISEQVNVVEDDIAGLYDDWFIETCEDWVVPYIGELIGWEAVHEAGEPGEVTTERGRARNRILLPRREVANTIAHRRRKGTLALLELLARDVAGWPARAVEFYELVGGTQSLNHQRSGRRSVDVRSGETLDRLGGFFDELAHAIDVRRIASGPRRGSYNIPSVGLYVWRLRAYPVTHAPAACIEEVGPHCFTFSVLGNDAPLFARPAPEMDPGRIAEERNLPGPIRRRAFEERVREGNAEVRRAAAAYYGVVRDGSLTGDSLAIWAPDWPQKGQQAATEPIPREKVIPADLRSWTYAPSRGFVAVDPVLGRLVFPIRHFPKEGVWVSYHYGFSADLGGGEYQRPLSQPEDSGLYRVTGQDQLRAALANWQARETDSTSGQRHTVIEIMDSGVYVLPIRVSLAPGHSLQIRAGQRRRPVLRLLDWYTERPDSLTVTGGPDSRFVLDGLLVTGRGLRIEGELASVTIRHSTLVPGWSLDPECEPRRPAEPSIELINTSACLVVEHSIVGSVQVNLDEVSADPVPVHVSDSIIDATGADCDSPECEAIGAAASAMAHATLSIARATVIGRVMTHAIQRADNTIFMGRITVARRQVGCMRFSYVTPWSRTPRRFHCQPDLAQDTAEEALRRQVPAPTQAQIEAARQDEGERVRPSFNSMRYGTPAYCQLAADCADEIVRGADDESEMGAFHDLYQPQRTANLRVRLDEYSPAASDTAIIFAT